MHTESTLAALEAGYDVLLEKPMSTDLHENVRLVQAAEEHGRLLQICHVLRYSPFFQKLHDIVQSGRLGAHHQRRPPREPDLLSHGAQLRARQLAQLRRRRTDDPREVLPRPRHPVLDAAPAGRQLQSFGSLTWFKPENAPKARRSRCTDGCPAAESCKYYAPHVYMPGGVGSDYMRHIVSLDQRPEAIMNALETGPYGRCVYHCDNDVVDHQSLNMELGDGTTITMTMQGQGNYEGRSMRWDGTRATLYGKFTEGGDKITIHDHLTGEVEDVPIIARDESGHGGGDYGIVRSFLNAVKGVPDDSVTTARESLESHLMAFAAEELRLTHTVVDMAEYRARVEAEAHALYQ